MTASRSASSVVTTSRSPSASMSVAARDMIHDAGRSTCHFQSPTARGSAGHSSQPMVALSPLEPITRSIPLVLSTSVGMQNIHCCLPWRAGNASVLHCSAFRQSLGARGAQWTKTERVFPSVQVITSVRPSGSRSTKVASSTLGVAPTVTAGQRCFDLSGAGFRYRRVTPEPSKPVAMSGRPSALRSASFTPSAPLNWSSMTWRFQGPAPKQQPSSNRQMREREMVIGPGSCRSG